MKGYKTFVFGLIVALLPLLDYVNSSDIFSTFMSDPVKQHWATFAVGAMIIILRAVTNTPMFQQSGFKVDEIAPVATGKPTYSTPTTVPPPSETPVSEPSAIETPVTASDTPSILPTDTATDTKGA